MTTFAELQQMHPGYRAPVEPAPPKAPAPVLQFCEQCYALTNQNLKRKCDWHIDNPELDRPRAPKKSEVIQKTLNYR